MAGTGEIHEINIIVVKINTKFYESSIGNMINYPGHNDQVRVRK